MITSVTFPMMSRAGQLDTEQVSRAFAHTTNLLWVASLPICIATVGVCMSKPVNSMRPSPEALNARIHSIMSSTSSVFHVQKYIPAMRSFGSPSAPSTDASSATRAGTGGASWPGCTRRRPGPAAS